MVGDNGMGNDERVVVPRIAAVRVPMKNGGCEEVSVDCERADEETATSGAVEIDETRGDDAGSDNGGGGGGGDGGAGGGDGCGDNGDVRGDNNDWDIANVGGEATSWLIDTAAIGGETSDRNRGNVVARDCDDDDDKIIRFDITFFQHRDATFAGASAVECCVFTAESWRCNVATVDALAEIVESNRTLHLNDFFRNDEQAVVVVVAVVVVACSASEPPLTPTPTFIVISLNATRASSSRLSMWSAAIVRTRATPLMLTPVARLFRNWYCLSSPRSSVSSNS